MSQEVEVGQRWYGLRPGAYGIIEVTVEEVTEQTVLVRQEAWGLSALGAYRNDSIERYLKGEFTFVELLPPKPVVAPGTIVEVPAPPRPTMWESVKGWFA